MGAAIFGEDFVKSVPKSKVRPHKNKSVTDEMMEKARQYREDQMAVSRLNRFAHNAGANVPYKESSFVAKAREAWREMTEETSRRGGSSLAAVGRSMRKGLALVSNGFGLGGGGGGDQRRGGHRGDPSATAKPPPPPRRGGGISDAFRYSVKDALRLMAVGRDR